MSVRIKLFMHNLLLVCLIRFLSILEYLRHILSSMMKGIWH